MLKRHLLMTTAAFAPPGEGNGGEGEDQHVEDQDTEGQEGDDALEAGEQDAAADEGADEIEGSEGDDEGQIDEPPARRPNRAQSRIQSLTQTLAQEKAERQRIDRELMELRAEQRARQQPQGESAEAKAARRALMDPMEVMREDLKESEQRTAALLQRQAIQQQETSDKLLYNSILRDAPHLKKYDAEVEKIRKEQEDRGVFVPREVLLDLAIGRAARAAATKAAPKAKKEGQQRIAAQQSRPAGARGDTATARGKQGDSPESRLLNVPI
jgi:hypothetical protein